MFTGIVHGIAVVLSIQKQKNFQTFKMQFPSYLIHDIKIGDSISNNGCCLTVSKMYDNNIYFDAMDETLKTTNLGLLQIGSLVNIERSLKFGDEVGGHLMSGHIIGTAKILNVINYNNNKKIFFQVKNDRIMKYIFLKGFIGVNGISLTVSDVYKNIFCVYFVPETIISTNIKNKTINSIVNIEVDYYTQIVVDKLDYYLKYYSVKNVSHI
ncbi:riboflavin synthase subunit alpha [Buchnera aphidicola (Takecallis taiwana)]|uniref:riboflavin synthase subunit alpha n=1 Tax=Buchnera aphidicola TaxID=9 RepID=UPI0031B72FDD